GLREQVSSLAKDQRPWFEERLNTWVFFRMLDGQIQMFQLDSANELEMTYHAYLAEPAQGRRDQLLPDIVNVIFYGATNGKVAAYVFTPRHPQLVTKGQFALCVGDHPDFKLKNMSQLSSILAELDEKYPIKRQPHHEPIR